MTTENRIDWIDISKGIGIILVVLGHTIVPQIRGESRAAEFLWIFIYSFHMPLFFFLSGYLFEMGIEKYTNKKHFFLSKARKLLLPYLFFSVFAYVFIAFALRIDKLAAVLEGGGYSAAGFFEAAFEILTYNGHIDQHIWFVFSLFIVFLINILLPKLMKNPYMLIVLVALYVSKAFVKYYGILDYTASDLFFFSLARVVFSRDLTKAVKKLNPALLTAVFIAVNCGYTAMYMNNTGGAVFAVIFYVYREAAAVLGIAAVCRLAAALGKTGAAGALARLGGYSYDIYLMHAPFLVSGISGILLAYSPLPHAAICVLTLILGLTLPVIASKLVIRRVPILKTVILGERLWKTA